MAETLDFSSYARPRDDGAAELELAVDGVTCGACITRIETAVKRLPGVTDARLNFSNRRLNVAWADGEARPDEVLSTLAQLGYRGHPFKALKAEEQEAAQARWLMRCLSVAGFAAMNIMLLSVSVWSGNSTDITPETRDLFHWASALIALPAAAYAGQPFFQSAIRALRVRQLNMDVPISLGVLLALGMSVIETANHASHAYFDSAIMLLFFLLCGRYLDHALRRKTRAVAGNLAALKGEVAHRFEGNEITSIPAQAVKASSSMEHPRSMTVS
jgi:Cu2+-exporting ATPase